MSDASAMPEEAGADLDATATVDAASIVEDGAVADGGTCTIPALAQSSATCQVMHNADGVTPCGVWGQYELYCSAEPEKSLACGFLGTTRGFGVDYCCPCTGINAIATSSDAGSGCVNVDIWTYDRTCTKDSDCISIGAGLWCPGVCNCGGPGNAAINVKGQARYEQTIAPVLPLLNDNCNCSTWSESSMKSWAPVCLQGVCTVPNNP